MNINDFKFYKYDEKYEDYYFYVCGHTQYELISKYMEQSLVSISSVIYSKKEDKIYIKKCFIFNDYIIEVNEHEIREILLNLLGKIDVNEYLEKKKAEEQFIAEINAKESVKKHSNAVKEITEDINNNKPVDLCKYMSMIFDGSLDIDEAIDYMEKHIKNKIIKEIRSRDNM